MSKKEEIKQARIAKLQEVQANRKEDSLQRVYKAIERLQKIDAKVNFTTVAREANLSVSYLYKYPEVKFRIAEVRNQQRSFPTAPVAQANSTASAKVTTKLRERITQLERENQELKRKNEALAGQVYRVHYLQEQIERQQQTITDLQVALKDRQSASKVTPISTKRKATTDDLVRSELEGLGIELNATLTKTIKSATEATVLDAIEVLKEQLEKKSIDNPGGWLNQAIKDGWTKPEPAHQIATKPTAPAAKTIATDTQAAQPQKASIDRLKQLSNIFNKQDK